MPTKPVKLVVLFLVALAILACVGRPTPQLPPPVAPGSADSGWKDY